MSGEPPPRSLDQVLALGVAFVAERGRPAESALAGALASPEAEPAFTTLMSAAQRGDGAFVYADFFWDPVAGTVFALSVLDAFALLAETPAADAAAWLRTVQRDDGAFAAPAESDPRILTGLLTGFLAKSPRAHTQVIDGGAEFLARHWSPDVVRSGDLGAIAAYAHTFSNLPHEAADEILQWCGRELERAVRGGRVHPAQALRVFALCDSVALPGAPSDAQTLWPVFLAGQGADGGWCESAPSDARVAVTLDALLALHHFARRAPFATGA